MSVQRHRPIREQVATIVRNAIIEQQFKAGQVMVERELCEMTEASRASVREAIRQLEAEGLVETQNGRGVVVTSLTPAIAKEVYEVRAALEGLAARLFASRANDDDRDALKAAIDRLGVGVAEGWTAKRLLGAKKDIYDVLFQGAGNSVLRQQVESLQHRVTQFRALTLSHEGRPVQTLQEMQELLDAIMRRDESGAEKAAVRHIECAAAVSLDSLGA